MAAHMSRAPSRKPAAGKSVSPPKRAKKLPPVEGEVHVALKKVADALTVRCGALEAEVRRGGCTGAFGYVSLPRARPARRSRNCGPASVNWRQLA